MKQSLILDVAEVLYMLLEIYFIIGVYQGFTLRVKNKFLKHLYTLAVLPLWQKFTNNIFRGAHVCKNGGLQPATVLKMNYLGFCQGSVELDMLK